MPKYTEEELMNMDAIATAFFEQYNFSKNMEYEDIKYYAQLAYGYKVDNVEQWTENVENAEAEEVNRLVDVQHNLQNLLQNVQKRSLERYKNDNNKPKTEQNFAVKSLKYEDVIPEEARHLILQGDYLRIRDEICSKFEKEYNEFHLKESEEREAENAKIQNSGLDKEAYEAIKEDREYKYLLAEKAKLETKIKDLKEKYGNDKEQYEKLKATVQQGIDIYDEKLQARASTICPGIYQKQASDREAALFKLEQSFNKKVDDKFKEIDKKIKDEFDKAIKDRIKEENKRIQPSVQNFIKANIEPAANEIKAKQVQSKKKLNYSNVDEDYSEIENNIISENEKKKSREEAMIGEQNLAKKLANLMNYEDKLPGQLLNAIKNDWSFGAVPYNRDHFMDDPNAEVQPVYDRLRDYQDAYQREIIAVKDTFEVDKVNFRVAHFDHFERISGIHKILKDNKKTGLTKNSTEYKAVLTELDTYEKGLIEKGWYDVVKAEKEGRKLTPEQEQMKVDMLDQLDRVFESASTYMIKKGPEKKNWGHGQARYELMYLLCDEIYARGGHAAEAQAREARIEKEVRAHKQTASAYLHQIKNAAFGGADITAKYQGKITAAIEGTARVPGTRAEIARKHAEYMNKGSNEIINPANNVIPNI
ncbi:hypothetical protein [Pseudobutyrivibrio sp.]|uniref:hypothetical protein n=1 Tax=Pseudobutyrivibrio sp. TaxID=2014367 RepID=UPI001D64FDC0|nr:hypothetical protein [Pseudobutyrivibrio sp.]MBE5910448.1 hypothetical protein [Pseudobutyrivibrio sp.]